MRRWLKRLAWSVLALSAALALSYWLWLPPAATMERESYAAMSDYITAGLTGESHDLGSVNRLVILHGRTTNGMFRLLPPTWSQFDSRMMAAEALLRSSTSQKLKPQFFIPAPYVFTNAGIEASDLTEAQQRAGYGVLTFSKVIFNHDATRAVFYTEHLCGLCGGGAFVAMEKRDGHWHVIDVKPTWVS